MVNCVVYRDGVRPTGNGLRGGSRPACPQAPGRLRLDRPARPGGAEFAGVAELFGLHPLAVEDAVHAHQRPKVERYDDTLFSVFKTVTLRRARRADRDQRGGETGELMVFTGPDFVITVRHGGHGSLGPSARSWRPTRSCWPRARRRSCTPSPTTSSTTTSRSPDAVQNDIDAVETDVFSETGGRGDAGRIYQLKRELLELKRAVAPLLRPLQLLATQPMPVIPQEIQTYFRDVADHLTRVTEQIDAFDDLLDSILQAHLAQVTVAQNEDMRKITAWAAIIAVPTMVCGVYGMNFDHMPELRWSYGYPLVLTVIAGACFVLHRNFKRNGWL